eukprot:CAMPEP_0175168118 /NCGR_PEP_ID=MMETSP0087-20121206/28763_1 /TAXON_ID=136419 /ORGANISM="Unknown Unknown, Strain D1" /LENGTH=412 /DNA_ID=CAMNT_0016458169 /DNA_START=40 /DNA_END=1275 /DNA_ORIENTATION=-
MGEPSQIVMGFDFRGARGSSFDTSSQKKHWLFSPGRIEKIRQGVSKRVFDSVRRAVPRHNVGAVSNRLSVSPAAAAAAVDEQARGVSVPFTPDNGRSAINSLGASPALDQLASPPLQAVAKSLQTPAQATSAGQTGMTPFLAATSLATPAGVGASTTTPAVPITSEEQQDLLLYYSLFIKNCVENMYPNDNVAITATAISFLKRFYLFNSIMEHKPDTVTVTCINLASKAEERSFEIEKLAKITETKVSDIVECEVLVLEGIKFHLRLYHPFIPLVGLAEEMKCKNKDGWDESKYVLVKQNANKLIESSFFTDCVLCYPPSRIAMAALAQACKDSKVSWFDIFFASFQPETPEDQELLNSLKQELGDIQKQLVQGFKANQKFDECDELKKKARAIKKKLKPFFDSGDEAKKK